MLTDATLLEQQNQEQFLAIAEQGLVDCGYQSRLSLDHDSVLLLLTLLDPSYCRPPS